jgi:phosphoribosylanthranilate isomerase
MTKIKLCGLRREADIEAANELRPDYIGFVFAGKSRRAVDRETAVRLKALLSREIQAVGVFVNAQPETVAFLLEEEVIDLAQLHGQEDEEYISRLRELTDKPLIQAFRIRNAEDARRAEKSTAEYILLDAGAGDGKTFEWELAESVERPYFLAGGLTPENAGEAAERLHPFALDVSSGIETDGWKDPAKMRAFVNHVRRKER